MFTQFHNPPSLHGEILDFYLANGWFRSGQFIYTSLILNFDGILYSPVRIRLPLVGYEFRKSVRKIWKKNQKFTTIYRKAFISREKEELYQRHKMRFDGFVSQTLKDSLQDGGETTVYDTYEVAVYDGEKLIAASFFDLGEKSMASIYGMFDPDYGSYSLGFYTMLAEISYGKKNGFEQYYPGYIIPGYPKFDYKMRIGNVHFFKAKTDEWLPLEELKNLDLPSQVIEHRIVKLSAMLKKNEVPHQIYFYPLFDKNYMGNVGELAEMESPLFIHLQGKLGWQNLAIEYDLQKQCYKLGQYHGFMRAIQNFYDPTTHQDYETFRTLLIRQVLLFKNEKCESIVEAILKLSNLV